MKSLSSVILGVGLALSGGYAVAADAPGSAAKSGAAKGGAEKSAAKGAAKGSGKAAAAAAPEAAPAAPTVALEPDGVAFGMSADDVAKLYDRWWDKQFIPRYQKANPGPKTKELDFELGEKKKVLRRVAIFDGRMTSFDRADFHEEFAHGSDETMISSKLSRAQTTESTAKDAIIKDAAARDAKPVFYTRRFFFYRDKLWKVYDEYRLVAASPFGADFKEATARVEASLGKTAKRTRGPEWQFENVVFDAGNTRVRVVKLPKDSIAVVRSDNALTKEVLDRRAQQAKVPEGRDLDDDIQAVIR